MGEQIILFTGDGCEYLAEISEVSRKAVFINIIEKKNMSREAGVKIHLIQALSKSDRMDWAIQKAVELGVTEITITITQHCAVKLTENNLAKKLDHWSGIIISACEQSGRNKIPKLNSVITWDELFKKINRANLNIIFHPAAQNKFSEIKENNKNISAINICVGPEGGFNEKEVKLAEQNGFLSVRIGSRILRTETATITALSAIQSRWGDF